MTTNLSRRGALGFGGASLLSATAIGVLAAQSGIAYAGSRTRRVSGDAANDVNILNTALGLEHEAIEAYQIGAESGLLQNAVVPVAVLFQSHHKGHRDALTQAIQRLGGAPVAAKSRAEYMTALNIAATVKSQADVLKLAQRLERGAANAYIGVIPSFRDGAFAQVCARLAADETMHWTALTQALGEALPTAPLTFGA